MMRTSGMTPNNFLNSKSIFRVLPRFLFEFSDCVQLLELFLMEVKIANKNKHSKNRCNNQSQKHIR